MNNYNNIGKFNNSSMYKYNMYLCDIYILVVMPLMPILTVAYLLLSPRRSHFLHNTTCIL